MFATTYIKALPSFCLSYIKASSTQTFAMCFIWIIEMNWAFVAKLRAFTW